MSTWNKPREVKLLSGGNPQIPKGDGVEPVAAYIEAMPGWKRVIGERLDQLVVTAVPDVHKKVRWNQPLYGIDADTVVVSFRCFTRYVQLCFHNGASLDPMPPRALKHPDARYLDLYEHDDVDEAQLVAWFAQASQLPGEKL